MDIVKIKTSELKPHPLNAEIYGQDEDISDLLIHHEMSGRIDPLVVNQNNEVISGNRRLKLANAKGIEEVDCEIRSYESEEQELEDILSANAGRRKSNRQLIMEGMTWEKVLAPGAKSKARQNLAPKGKTRDRVAELVIGLGSGENYRKGKAVILAIDYAKKTGDTEKAQELEQLLASSIDAAHKRLKSVEVKPDSSLGLGAQQYIYEGSAKVLGDREIVAGTPVNVKTSMKSSDPGKTWIYLGDPQEAIQISWDELRNPNDLWRNASDCSATKYRPSSVGEHLYIKATDLSIEEQLAYSLVRVDLIREGMEYYAKQGKPELIDNLGNELRFELELQGRLTSSSYTPRRVEVHKKQIRGSVRVIYARKSEPETSFKVGDRVKAVSEKLCFGTVVLSSDVHGGKGNISISFDDYSWSALDDGSLKVVSLQQEWEAYQLFPRRYSSNPDIVIEVEFEPEKAGSGYFTKFCLKGLLLQQIPDAVKVVSDEDTIRYIEEGIKPVDLAQRLADEHCAEYLNDDEVDEDDEDAEEAETSNQAQTEGTAAAPPEEEDANLATVRTVQDWDTLIDKIGIERLSQEFRNAGNYRRVELKRIIPGCYGVCGLDHEALALQEDLGKIREMRSQAPVYVQDALRLFLGADALATNGRSLPDVFPTRLYADLTDANGIKKLIETIHLNKALAVLRMPLVRGVFMEYDSAVILKRDCCNMDNECLILIPREEQDSEDFQKMFSPFGVLWRRA